LHALGKPGITRRTAICASGAAALAAGPALSQGRGGLSQSRLDTIPAILRGPIEAGTVSGVVALVWRKGELVRVDTAGLRDVDRRLPMERSTIFRVASMTKPVTVATALTLVEQGRMRLEDPITKWAPEFANMRVLRRPDGPLDETYAAPRALTIEDLMTHRAGMPYPFFPSPLANAVSENFGFPVYSRRTPDDWMKTMAALPLADAPGERFNYGLAMDVLGVIVGRAAGTSFRQAVLDRVCGPLGMRDTDFWIPPAKLDRQAQLYLADPAKKAMLPVSIPEFVGPRPQAFVSGGGGLVTTADDYLVFARMLMRRGEVDGRRLLKRETVHLMTTNRLTPQQRQGTILPIAVPGVPAWNVLGFGLGVSMVTDPQSYAASGAGVGSAGAFTWSGIFGGWWQADPAQDMVLVWLVQGVPGFVASQIPGAPPAPTGPGLPMVPGMYAGLSFNQRVYSALT
jgi:CubicO group peptidase (beta-lactamase class C family)